MENKEKQRSPKQNNALHKLFAILATDLNTKGLDAKLILKENYQILWTPEMIKRDLWKPLQKAMLQKESTASLTPVELQQVYEQLAKIIGEKHGVEIDFPSMEEISKMQSYKNI
jgi:hypothetical protein